MSTFSGHSRRKRKEMRRQVIERPIKIALVGNPDITGQFIGPAKSQMAILRNEMGFQRLNQGIRRVKLSNGIYVECIKKYNQEICRIIQGEIPTASDDESEDVDRLLIVAGSQERVINLTGVAGAFESGESVLCGSDGYGTITFASEIGSGGTQTIYGSFVHCYDGTLEGTSSLAQGNISQCSRRHFERLYEHSEIYKKPPQQLVVEDPKSYFSIMSALDATNPSNMTCTDITTLIDKEWSKTHGKFMVSVFTYTIVGVPLTFWAASASYDGKILTWNGEQKNYPSVGAGGFFRTVIPNTASLTNPVKTHMGFDVWVDADGVYHVGLISDQGATLYVFHLDTANSDMILDHQYTSTVREKYYPDEDYPTISDFGTKYVRLLGYGYIQSNSEHVAYWAALGRGGPFYYSEVLNGGAITEHSMADNESIDGGTIESAIWNPIKRQIYFMFESASGDTEITSSFDFSYWFVKTCVNHPAAGYGCCWDEGGVYVPPGSWSCEDEGTQVSDKTDCQIQIEVDGEYYLYDAFCTEYPDGHDNLAFCYSYWAGILKNPTSETYMGLFKVDSDDYPKGSTKSFSIEDCEVSTSAPSYPTGGDNCCNTNGGLQVVSKTYNRAECEPDSVYRYLFDKWVFANDDKGHSYQYQENAMEQIMACEANLYSGEHDLECAWKCKAPVDASDCTSDGDPCTGTPCECAEYDWDVKESGNSSLLKAASGTFPYDDGWTAVLLNGTDSYGNEHEGWVIYRDLVDGGFFAVSDDGTEYPVGDVDRSFFFNMTETMEVP